MTAVDWVGTEPLHTDMSNDQLKILGNLHVVDRKVDRMLGDFLAPPPGVSQDRESLHTLSVTHFQSFDDIRRIAAARENDQHIAGIRLNLDLLSKDLLVSNVIRKRGENGSVRTKCFYFETPTVRHSGTIKEVVGKVHGVTRTAP